MNIPPTVEESASDGFIEAMNEAAGGIECHRQVYSGVKAFAI